jgi:hypothetical protein
VSARAGRASAIGAARASAQIVPRRGWVIICRSLHSDMREATQAYHDSFLGAAMQWCVSLPRLCFYKRERRLS